jgi:hypothetical protein
MLRLTFVLYALLCGAAILLFVFLQPFGVVGQTIEALWIPAAMCLFLVLFPIWVVGFNSLLFHGLFDMDLSPNKRLPVRHFLVTLTAFAVSASAWSILRLVLVARPARTNIHILDWPWVQNLTDLYSPLTATRLAAAILPPLALAAFFASFAVAVSWRQGKSPIAGKPRPFLRLVLGVAAALVLGALLEFGALQFAHWWLGVVKSPPWWLAWFRVIELLGLGYEKHWADHGFAILVSVLALLFYIALGYTGFKRLGTAHTVSALGGPLMAVLVLGWWAAAAQFFLDGGPIPLLAAILVAGIINTWIPYADHTYEMVDRSPGAQPKPGPYEVLTADGRKCAILVAAAGGGIQAAAWTAKVLQELDKRHPEKFSKALTLISSISGGSTGSAIFVNWLAHGAQKSGLPSPFTAASDSSLDEASWGLAWPDLLRLFLPWPFHRVMDRAHSLEQAWLGNATNSAPNRKQAVGLNAPLSDWNAPVAQGKLPALIMNSTIVETGGPLLLGTSQVTPRRTAVQRHMQSVWMDGDDLHIDENNILRDIPVVRGARLSATFPFVTPAAKPARALQQPHMVDGGFYDNYGMATLTEWLDQALEDQEAQARSLNQAPQVTQVLVIEINGFPPNDPAVLSPARTQGGWIKQLIAPILALVNVRTAGQVSHRDLELKLLIEKWQTRGITITPANFELSEKDAPLSWHLMPTQIEKIANGWDHPCNVVAEAKNTVDNFLASC